MAIPLALRAAAELELRRRAEIMQQMSDEPIVIPECMTRC